MKTSNKILLVIAILGVAWIAFRTVILSSGIPKLVESKPSPFVNLLSNVYKAKIEPFTDISLKTKGSVRVVLQYGQQFGISGDKSLKEGLKIAYSGKTILVSYEYDSSPEGYLLITSPTVNHISYNSTDVEEQNYTKLQIKGYSVDSLTLDIEKCGYFNSSDIDDCKVNNLIINVFAPSKMRCNLSIGRDNQINNLTANIKGNSFLDMNTAGSITNTLNIADSVDVTFSGKVLKMLKK